MCFMRVTSHAKATNAKLANEVQQEASFQEWWRESRSHSMKPAVGASATERMNALRQRVAARSAARSPG